jgi:hypothetical protein
MKRTLFMLLLPVCLLVFVIAVALSQEHIELHRHHCLDGTRWRGHFSGDPAGLNFVDGKIIFRGLNKVYAQFDPKDPQIYECGRDGNIYFGRANCLEFILIGNKLAGNAATDGSEFEEIVEHRSFQLDPLFIAFATSM